MDHCTKCGSTRVVTEEFTRETLLAEYEGFGAVAQVRVVRRRCLNCWHQEETLKPWEGQQHLRRDQVVR